MSHVPTDSTGEKFGDGPRTDGAGRGSRSRSLDAILKLLTDRRRREALYVLYRREEPMPVADLADEVASVVPASAERVGISLHHVHLPKLAGAGVVDYDRDSRTARFADDSDRFERFLRVAASDEGRFVGLGDDPVESDEPDASQSQS